MARSGRGNDDHPLFGGPVTRGWAWGIGAATFVPIPLLLIFTALLAEAIFGDSLEPGPGQEVSVGFIVLLGSLTLAVLWSFSLLGFYLVNVPSNDAVPRAERSKWIVLLVILGPISMPVYWWRYVRPGSRLARAHGGDRLGPDE